MHTHRTQLERILQSIPALTPNAVLDALFQPQHVTTIVEYATSLQCVPNSYQRIFIPDFRPLAANEWVGSQGARYICEEGKRNMEVLIKVYGTEIAYKPLAAPQKRRISMTVLYGKGTRKHDADAFDKVAKDACQRAKLCWNDNTEQLEWLVKLEKQKDLPWKHATLLEVWDLI
jgi:hypothetical protein